jgi:hypothetical protein
MNKIKLIYDVVMNLKEKERFVGKMVASGTKMGQNILDANIGFEKDFKSGLCKSDVSILIDSENKKFKHESKTEIVCSDEICGEKHKKIFGHIHKFHHNSSDFKCCHGKSKLSKLAFGLQLLNNIKLEELSDDKVQLTLNLSDLSEGLCKEIHDKIQKHCENKQKDHFKNCCNVDRHNGNIEIIVNDKKDIEKVILSVSGLKNNGKEDIVIAEFKGQVDFFE